MAERWPAAMILPEAAEYLGLKSVDVVEKLLREGKLGAVRYTARGDRRILRSEMDAFLETLREDPIRA